MKRLGRIAPELALVLGLATACSKDEPLDTSPQVPHRIHEAPVRAQRTPVIYRVTDGSHIDFSLPARKATPRGILPRVEGELQVDLMALAATRGTLRVDLRTLTMNAGAASDAGATETAKNWLEAQREPEQFRYATFAVHRLEKLSAAAAHEGQLVHPREPRHDEHETRRVNLAAVGSLTFHGRRAEQSLQLVATFEYSASALSGAAPSRIDIETRRPLRIPIETYDLLPRAADGTVVASALKRLGTDVGRRLAISVKLHLEPATNR